MKNAMITCLLWIVVLFAAILNLTICVIGFWSTAATNWANFVKLVERFAQKVGQKVSDIQHSLECLIKDTESPIDETEVNRSLLVLLDQHQTEMRLTPFQIHMINLLATWGLITQRASIKALAPASDWSHINGSEVLDTINWLSLVVVSLPQPNDSLKSDGSAVASLGVILLGGSLEPLMLAAAPAPLGAIAPAKDEIETEDALPDGGSLEPFMLAAAPAPLGAIAPAKDEPSTHGEVLLRPANRTAADLNRMKKDQLFEVIENEILPWASSLVIPERKKTKADLKRFIRNFYTALG